MVRIVIPMKAKLVFTLLLIAAGASAQSGKNTLPQVKNAQPSSLINTTVTDQTNNKTTSGISCTPNVFWAIKGIGNVSIDEMSISGGAVVSTGTLSLASPAEGNLAYCNNLNGGSFSPTFYSTENSRIPRYFDGAAWVNAPVTSAPDKIYNCGANGNYLYYLLYDSTSVSKGIARFTGTSLTTLYSWGNTRRASVADLSVDEFGNVWFFTGPNIPGTISTDSLLVVSPTGQLLHEYAINLNTSNAYGSLLVNGNLYIAFGPNHPLYPNALLPIVINGTSVTTGTALAMPVPLSAYADLESCNPGDPLSVAGVQATALLSIYPNPVVDVITIYLPEGVNESVDITIVDALGKVVYAVQNRRADEELKIEIDGSSLAAGNYIIKLQSTKVSYTGKLLKL